MRELAWLGLACGALVVHEALAARRGALDRFAWVRRAVLLSAVAAALMVDLSAVRRVYERRLAPPPSAPVFVPSGDVWGLAAVTAQRPRHPFPSGGDAAAVEAWRGAVLEDLRARLGLDVAGPSSVPLSRVSSDMDGRVRRTLVTYVSWDGATIPAYLHEPADGHAKGALLVIAGHGVGIRGTAGLTSEYQHAAARALAEQGYITLSPELRGFGLLASPDGANHRVVAAAALEAGSSYKALVVRDLALALTALAHWPGVDATRLGVAGTSLGGELAVLLAALDTRVALVMSHSYGGSVGPAAVDDAAIDDATQTPHGCHTMPGENQIVWQEDWVRLVAPRPVLIVRGDRNTPPEAAAFQTAVGQAYSQLAAGDRFAFTSAPGGHEFYLEPSLEFLERWW